MALVSMTGYGRCEVSAGGVKVDMELSSVNRRQFDVRVGLPRPLLALEARVHEAIHRVLSRGGVVGNVKISTASGSGVKWVAVDAKAVSACIQALRKTAKRLGLRDDLSARTLAQLPDIVRFEKPEDDPDRVWPLLKKALEGALEHLVKMRRAEGAALERDLVKRFKVLEDHARRIGRRAPEATRRYRSVLAQRLRDAGVMAGQNDPALLREIALFADRSDISEELVRLGSHFGQAAKMMGSRKPAGRALDFLCQEMSREINTIGSKANLAAISRQVVEFKAMLESIREQVQNIE